MSQEQSGQELAGQELAGQTKDAPLREEGWHGREQEALLTALSTDGKGLSASESAERLLKYGRNDLPAKKPPTLLQIFVAQFKDTFIYILLAAAALSLYMKEYTDAGFIFLVLLVNAAIGTYQEASAEKSAAALQEMLKTMAKVVRDGKESVVDASLLVPGDLVLLESGDRVPADMRILSSANLTIDESFLTGENIPPLKKPGVLPAETVLGDRTNMCFAGSRVMTGRAQCLVVATGLATEVGRIAAVVNSGDSAKPPLLQRMEKFSKQLTLMMCGLVVFLGAICMLVNHMGWQETMLTAVALAVAAIPEGLPVAITVALSIGVSCMAKRHVIVRKLPAVEGLGSCTCIASDKTGTLTVNRQTVKKVCIPGLAECVDVTGEGYGEGKAVFGEGMDQSKVAPLVREAAVAGILCNEGTLNRKPDGSFDDRGDAMDLALLAFASKVGVDVEKTRADLGGVATIAYESEKKYAGSFNRRDGAVQVSVKGALETVASFCDTMMTPEGVKPLDMALLEAEALKLAEGGYRVLAIAKGTTDKAPEGEPDEKSIPRLTMLALAGFMDPLRPEVVDAVSRCRKAGIRVVMVTGDHPATAFAIAHQLGIADSPDQVRVGADLAKMDATGEEFRKSVDSGRVFARVAPMQKVEIVEALKNSGNYVAVTGDGVNDAPALKKANCGVAMGSGTDVAKDTASIVVTDDNFASIEAGVEEGRVAYDNIRKVTFLLVSCGFAELMIFTLSVLFGLPMPLAAVQLLWLNMVTNGIQDVALSFEKGEPDIMDRKPRPPSQGLFDHRMIWQTAVFSLTMTALCFGLWHFLMSNGWNTTEKLPEARNLLLLLMVLIENVQAFSVRSERRSAFSIPLKNNPLLIGGIVGAQVLQIACMNLPFVKDVLKLNPVSIAVWGKMLGLSLVALLVMEIFKVVYGRIFGKRELVDG